MLLLPQEKNEPTQAMLLLPQIDTGGLRAALAKLDSEIFCVREHQKNVVLVPPPRPSPEDPPPAPGTVTTTSHSCRYQHLVGGNQDLFSAGFFFTCENSETGPDFHK